LYKAIVEFGVAKELIMLINMYLNDSCNNVLREKYLFHSFYIQNYLKQEDI